MRRDDPASINDVVWVVVLVSIVLLLIGGVLGKIQDDRLLKEQRDCVKASQDSVCVMTRDGWRPAREVQGP
jgi:amino acid permease